MSIVCKSRTRGWRPTNLASVLPTCKAGYYAGKLIGSVMWGSPVGFSGSGNLNWKGARFGIAIMNGTRESAILWSGIREIIPLTNREPWCPLTRNYEEIDLLSPWKVPGVQTLKRSDCSAILFSVNENYIRCEGNGPKILNGPQGNVASKTAASMKTLKGLEKLLASLRIKRIWCYQPVKTLLHAKVLFREQLYFDDLFCLCCCFCFRFFFFFGE